MFDVIKMPVTKNEKTGKWRIGSGKAIYTTKKNAETAQQAYYASKNKNRK